MDENGFCSQQGFEADDDNCPRVIMVGQAYFPKKKSEEYKFAYNSLMSRHPNLKKRSHTYKIIGVKLEDVLLIYGSEELRCSTIPLYLSSVPKYFDLQELLDN